MITNRRLTLTASLMALAFAVACASGSPPGDQVDGGGLGERDDTIIDAGADAGAGTDGGSAGGDECDLHEQTGCAEQDACDLEFTNFEDNEFTDQLACRGILVPGQELSRCSSPSGCDAGYQCVGGQCRRYCQDDTVCGGPGGQCAFDGRADSKRDDDRLCSKSCEPDFQADHSESCPGTFSCYIRFVGSDDDRRAVTDCRPTGPIAVNDDCSEDRCGEGLVCTTFRNSEGEITSERCQRRCRVDDQTCPDGNPCEGFSTPTLVDGIEYGICRSSN